MTADGRQRISRVHAGLPKGHGELPVARIPEVREANETDPTLAGEALAFIGENYAIERLGKRWARHRPAHRVAQRESKPVLDRFRAWLEVTLTKALPAGALAKAIRSVLDQWRPLIRFVADRLVQKPLSLRRSSSKSVARMSRGSIGGSFRNFRYSSMLDSST
jgi:hypothetical protein